MLDRMVNGLTFHMIRQGTIREEDEPIIRYGLQAMIEVSINVITILVISASLGQMIEAAAWLGTTILCSSFGGGYHAKIFISCYLISVTVFILSLLVIDGLSDKLFVPAAIVCFLTSMMIFIHSNILSRQDNLHSRTFIPMML